ncbi:hypothetical protein MATL_G00179100 [Megalops atlanticus]|uniref:Fibronectin type-III domain-containing protein n=1 Tax=Megalops atlanticus TaxID=7932 RepID=A0A9D3PR93_MEGAT|nr:hypothetical protein MATL_G00179100 [Megalops atlanticus]
MIVIFTFFFMILAFLAHAYKVSAVLPSPQNLTLQTLNTQYILRWQWDQGLCGNQAATFTAQYLAKYKLHVKKRSWESVCTNTLDTQCDFTGSNLHYLGIYMLRVRARCAGENSEWVQIEFCPQKHANLGPPSKVEVTSGIRLLEVQISDPLTSTNGSMKEIYPDMYYLIMYWKYSKSSVKSYEHIETSNKLVTLTNLEPWTMYCMRVQSRYDFYKKASHFSPTQCQQTTGQTPFWQIFLWFLASLVLCFLGVLLPSYASLRSYRVIKATFFPSYQLPSNIQEYLCDSSPGSDRPRLLTPESEVEVCCERLDVCPVVVLPEIHALPDPPASEQDTSRHSRQGSGDSGVYSEEGSGQTGTVATAGSKQASEQVKMVEMGTDPGSERLISAPCGPSWKSHTSHPSSWAGESVIEECV